MPTQKKIKLKNLLLDTANPRIVEVGTQAECIEAIFNDKPKQFKDLLSSIVKKGFYLGENILTIPDPERKGKYIVMEGNRRISALKLLHGGDKKLKNLSATLKTYINSFPNKTKEDTATVNCIVFGHDELDKLEEEIASRHLSGYVSRLDWPPVRKAKKQRELTGKYDPSLDLLEKYLELHPGVPSATWELFYPLTILDDFLPKLAEFLGYESAELLAKAYPDSVTVDIVNKLISEIYKPTDFLHIRELDNRRSKADAYLTSIFPKWSKTPVSNIQKPGPHERHTPSVTAAPKPSRPPASVPREPRIPRKNPVVEQAKHINILCHQTANSKLQTIADENLILTKTKNGLSFSKTLILRTLLDCSGHFLCKKKGNQPRGNKLTTGVILKHILDKKLIEDERHVRILTQIDQREIKSLNAFIHEEDLVPASTDIENNYANIQPLIIHFLEVAQTPASSSANAQTQ